MRRGDEQWTSRRPLGAQLLVIAEQQGLTAATARRALEDPRNVVLRKSVDDIRSASRALGLEGDWYLRVIEAGGNYGEIFERNLGAGSPLRMERGQNRLWTDGGLLYAPPAR